MTAASAPNRRVLVIDDMPAIRDDFRKLLGPPAQGEAALDSLEESLFGAARRPRTAFEVECAGQGEEGLALVRRSLETGARYAVAFVDMRMPPGWDGLETIGHLWAADPGLQVVICTAYSDYSWEEIVGRLGHGDNLLVLKKPFDTIEVVQMADALAEKWRLREAVASRTAELEESNRLLKIEVEAHRRVTVELRDAERLAALGVLAAGVAHEINNPLSYTLANLEFLAEQLAITRRELPESAERLAEVSSALQEARDGAGRIRQIVADMRTLSRVEKKEGARTNVVAAVEAALRQVAAAVGERARVVRDLTPLPEVWGEESRLTQVFVNLIQNAAQAIDPGAPERNQILLRSRAEQSAVSVEVTDTGSGISPEVMPRIFDAFFTTKPPGTGTGLGLSICHTIVTGLGGRIDVSSKAGVGTTFRVTLPIEHPAH